MASKTEKLEKSSRTAKSTKTTKPVAKAGKAKAGPAPRARGTKVPGKAAPAPAPPPRTKRITKVIPDKQLELGSAADETGELAEQSSTDAIALEGFAPVPDADDPGAAEPIYPDEDEDALHDRIVAEQAEQADDAVDAATPMSPEEQELAAIYGDEMAAAPAAAAHTEFTDARTADEDRQMLPEINGRVERQKRWEERREQRRSRRDQDRQRPGGRPAGGGAAGRPEVRADRPHGPGPDRVVAQGDVRSPDSGARPEPRPMAPIAPPPVATEAAELDSSGVIRVGNSLGDAAWQVFASIKGAQPMPVRQLAGMMRKRGLIDADPEVLWPHLKAALLGDERSYKSVGLRPRIVYRGRDLFGPGPVAQSATANAENDLARALSVMAVATHRTLKDRIASATQAGFERLVHAYMVAAGFRDIEWIKRVEGISYATALPPEGQTMVLVSARAGGQPVDRRGIGELRVGVEAKQLLAGYLFAARELSSDAERELERNGRSITVIAGDSFVSALLALGVGVVTAAAPVRYVDDQLLGELLAGVTALPWRWLGRVGHADAVAQMEAARERCLAGDAGAQVVLLAEHPPVITLGRSADAGHVVAPSAALATAGVELVRTSRGGDVTYHGPGQLMVYPVVRVRGGVVAYLAATAAVLAEVAAELGVAGAGFRREPAGLWLGDAKLAACGLHLRRQVAIHGWAFNVATPPAMWQLIVPCGLATPVVSLDEARRARGLGPAPAVAEVAALVGPRLAAILSAARVISIG